MTTFWSKLKHRVKNYVARALLPEPIEEDCTTINESVTNCIQIVEV